MRAVLLLLLSCCLAGCDTIAWGYVNRLPHRVTVVEHIGDRELRTALAPGGRIDPGFGQNRAFDLLDQRGVAFAHYRPSELRVVGSRSSFKYVVIRRGEIVVEPEGQALAGLPPRNLPQ